MATVRLWGGWFAGAPFARSGARRPVFYVQVHGPRRRWAYTLRRRDRRRTSASGHSVRSSSGLSLTYVTACLIDFRLPTIKRPKKFETGNVYSSCRLLIGGACSTLAWWTRQQLRGDI